MTPLYREIAEKRNILRKQYGGLMTLEQVKQELGYKTGAAARKAMQELEVPIIKIGNRKRYDTDILVKRLVQLRDIY